MIESFDTIEVWNKKDILEIPNDLNSSINDLVTEYLKDVGEDKSTGLVYSAMVTTFRQHKSRKDANCFIKFNIEMSKMFVHIYLKRNIRPYPRRITICNPEIIKQEVKKRGIISRDFQIEYPEYKIADIMNYFQGKAKPKLDFMIDFTAYLQGVERDLLDLPPSKGKRWDLDEWRRTANIPIKNSWEEKYD